MAADQMTAQAVGRAHGALQVHHGAFLQPTQRGQRQRLGGRIGLKGGCIERDHGQAHAVHRDALAELHSIERQRADRHGQADVAAHRLQRGDAADTLDDAGEHQQASARRTGKAWGSMEGMGRLSSNAETPPGREGRRTTPRVRAGRRCRLLSSGL